MYNIPEDIHEYILDELSGEITNENRNKLVCWINDSEENKKAWNVFSSIWLNGLAAEREKDINYGSLWNSVAIKSNKRRKKKIFFIITSVAASIAILFVVAHLILFNKNLEPISVSLSEYVNSIEPVAPKLILPSGEEINLSESINIEKTGFILSADEDKNLIQTSSISDITTIEYNTLIIPKAGEYTLSLADGSKVFLNSESSIKFPSSFNSETREVWITGEAYFIIAKKDSPFIAHTDNSSVKVLGTEFNIMAYEDEEATEITLVKGEINVDTDNFSEKLRPGQQFRMDNQTLNANIRMVDVDNYTMWKEGTQIFDDIRLEQLMVRLRRWYDFNFKFENDKLKDKLFTGGFRKYDSLEKILNMIENVNDVHFTVKDNTIIID